MVCRTDLKQFRSTAAACWGVGRGGGGEDLGLAQSPPSRLVWGSNTSLASKRDSVDLQSDTRGSITMLGRTLFPT